MLLLLSACDFFADDKPAPVVRVQQQKPNPFPGVQVFDRHVPKTLDKVAFFNLETPVRCNVDWDSQSIISAQPFDRERFRLDRVDKGDALPDISVEDLSFTDQTVDTVLTNLLRGTDIFIDSKDQFLKKINMKGVSGPLSTVIDLITSSADVYYSYDDRTRTVTLRRFARWNLHVPLSDEVLLSVIDALKGSDIDDIVIDWEDRFIIFQGDIITEGTVRNLINKLALEDYIVAYDIDVYRIWPREKDGSIDWMEITEAFNRGSVRLVQNGVIGRLFVVAPTFNRSSLGEFLLPRAHARLISTGKFATPERWQGRFDIGQCSREPHLETDLQILTQARFTPEQARVGKLDTTVVLKTIDGQIAQYAVPSRLGDNFMIIGIPTQYFAVGEVTPVPPNSELVVLISPRVINIVRTPDGVPTR